MIVYGTTYARYMILCAQNCR